MSSLICIDFTGIDGEVETAIADDLADARRLIRDKLANLRAVSAPVTFTLYPAPAEFSFLDEEVL